MLQILNQTLRRQGGSRNMRKGAGVSPSFPLPFPYLSPSSFRISAPRDLGERCKLPLWGPRRSPGRKRIWCTLMLSESCWWQSFSIFWVPCFTVKLSQFSVSYNMTVSDGGSPSPKGGGRSRLGPPLNPPLGELTTSWPVRNLTDHVLLCRRIVR